MLDRPLPGSKTYPVCGNPVFRKVMLQAKYCSRECRQKVATKTWREKQVAEIKVCLLCGTKFQRAWNAKYCSSRCRFKFNKAKG
jgi:predicted nucleic acid-binding Zn ribbon protein